MKSLSTPEIQETEFDYRLTFDGELLDVQNTSPDHFGTILNLSRTALLETIESRYQQKATEERGKGIVVPPPITVLKLGTNTDESSIFTQDGMNSPHYIRTLRQDIHKNLHPYLDVAEDIGFIPEVRLIKNSRAALLGRSAISLRIRAHNEQTSFSPEYNPNYFTDTYPCFRSGRSKTVIAGETDVLFIHGTGGLVEHTIPAAAIDTTVSVDTLLKQLSASTLIEHELYTQQLLATHCKFVGTAKTGELAVEVPAMPRENGKAFMYLPALNN